MKTAFIIGVTGQDGAYLSKLLLKKNYIVKGITRDIFEPNLNSLKYLGIEKQIELIEISKTDPNRIECILKKYKPDEIYNLAAQSSVGQSFIDPFTTVSDNILSVLSWLEGIKKLNLSTKFYQAHHITTGEGGCVITNDETLARIATSFRDWGRDCYCSGGENNTCGKRFSQQFGTLPYGYDHKYVYTHIGYNLKMTDMQAAIGAAQIQKLPDFVVKRKENFKKF